MSLRDKCREVFTKGFGPEVLCHILVDLCHFGETLSPDNKAMIGEYNIGVTLLADIGVFGPGMLGGVINTLCKIIPEKEEEENEKDLAGGLYRGLMSDGE